MPLGTSAPGHGKTRPTTTKPRQHKKKPTTTTTTHLRGAASLDPTTTSPLYTISKRFMGVRVSAKDKERQRKKQKQQVEKEERRETQQFAFKSEEVKSILPQRNVIDDATIQAQRLKTKPAPIGLSKAIFTTETVPTLSFNASADQDNDDDVILTNQDYIKKRKQDEEKLVWEHEVKKMKSIEQQLEKRKGQDIKDLAQIPGFELSAAQQERLEAKVVADIEKKQQKKKKSRGLYENELNDDDENDDDDNDDINPNVKKPHKQDSSDHLVERLTLAQQRIVNKIKSRAYQQGSTPYLYCKQNQLPHLIPLLGLRPFKEAREERERAAAAAAMGSGGGDQKKKQKRKYEDDEDGESGEFSSEDIDEHELFSDHDASPAGRDEYNNIDIDDVFQDLGDFNDEIGEFAIPTSKNNDNNNNNNKLQTTNNNKTTKNGALPSIIMRGVQPQNDADKDHRYELDTFDNLKPKPALGVRLNPKIFSRKTKNIDFSGDNNNNTSTTDKKNDDVDPSKIYVHRRRPAIPDSSFLELGINPGILSKLALKHIREPTAVQKMAIPFFSRKYNPRTKKIYTPPTVALQAFTGSGKTLAYAAPMLTNIDPNIANKIPPPNVIAATRQLLGIKSLPQPPPLEADPTPVDEVERKVRLIQYSNDTMFNADGSNVMRAEDINDKHAFFQDVFDQEDIAENDVETLFNTRQFIDRLTNEVDIFSMTPAQWEAYVFEQEVIERETRAKLQEKLQQEEEEQEEKQAPQQNNKNKNKNNKYNNNKTPLPARIDATIFNSRVYSLEAVRLRKKQAIQQKLKEIFPFIDPKLLDPDLPQSTLQSIIIVPTKELALQVSKELIEMNHTTYQSSKAIQGSHQFYGDKNIHVVPHKGKNPINIRMATGKVDPILLSSLGVFLHKNLDAVKQEQQELQNGGKVDENGNPITSGGHHQKTPTQLMRNQYNVKRGMDMASGKTMVQQDKYLDEQFTPEKARDHPFVEFGKGHKHFRPDQKEYRKELQEREKEQMMRVMRLRERQLQGEKLSTFEESEILIFDDKQQRKQHNKALQSKSSAVNGIGDDDDETYEDDYDEAVEVYSNNNNNNNGGDESDDFIEFIDEKDYDYEDNPEKLLKLSNRDLLKQYDNFRGDYFDPAHNKHIRKLSVEQRRELKTRLAVALTEQNETDYITQQTRAEKNRQDELMRMGLPVVRMQKRGGGEGGDDEMEKLKKRRKEEIKQRYMQEVSDTLLEQIGGQHGDFVEVVRERQPHVIVGTPSTITQLIKSGALQLPSTGPSPAQLKYMVFDEMDHLARNESSPEHHALLELLSLPTDQTAFVSASMTRDSARLLTRLARRQDQFINNTNPQRETVCNLLNFPRPPAQAIPEEVQEQAYNDAFAYAQEKVEHFQTEVASNDLALSEMVLGSTRAKKERIKALSDKLNDPEEKQGVIQKITDSLYKQNFAPTIPDDVFKANLQKSIDRGRLGLTSTSDEYGEVLFLSTEDYRVEKQQDGGNNNNNNKVDEHALPIPPFVKQYYLAPPEISPELLKQEEAKQGKKFNRLRYVQRVKDKLALDLICQFKLRPLTLKKNDRSAQKMELTEIAQKQQDMFFNNIDHTKAANHFNKHDAMGNDIEDDINMFSQHLAEEKKQQQQQYKSNAKKKMKLQTNITASEICPGTVLVFFNPRREEDMMDYYKQLSDTGLKVGIYCHASNRHQKYEVLTKNSKLDVILANDTLSRGLDFKSVSMVLNIDTPRSTSTYIHRSGRVGRVGGMYRKSAIVVNIADVQPQVLEKPEQEQEQQQENNDKNKTTTANDDTPPQIILPKGSETLTLLKHAEKTGVTVHSWPYVVPYNLNRVYLRSLKSIISQQAEEQGVARHLHRKAATEEYVKARNVKLHKMGIIQTRKSGLLSDLPEGYGDSAFQAKGGLGAGKKMQGIAINKLQNKVGQALRGGNSQPWIKTGGGDKSGKGGKTRTIKH